MTTIGKILVPVDFSPCSDAALDYALTVADACGAEVEILHVWRPRDAESESASAIFADTPEGIAMEQRLSAAESEHAHTARISGRLEFGDPATVIIDILERERFDLVVMGIAGDGSRSSGEDAREIEGHVAANVVKTAPCKVVTMPPPPVSPDEPCAA